MANHNVVFVEENGTSPAPLVKRQFRNACGRFGTANKKIIPLLLRKANAERSSNRPAGETQGLTPVRFPYTATPARPKDRPARR